MELTKIHPQTAHVLAMQQMTAPEVKPFISALNSQKVLESADDEIANTLAKAVSNAIFYLKHKPMSSDEFDLTIDALVLEVKQSFKGLTLDEIKLACLCGSKHQYGDIMGVGVSQVLQWLGAFIADQRRHRAKKQLILAQEVKIEPREVTEEDFKTLALNAFNRYKKTGKYEDYGNMIYHFLEKKGLINFCNQRKNEIKEAVLKMELTRLSAPLNLDEKRRFEREKNDLLNNPKDLKGMFKRHALNVFFADLCEMGTDLEIPLEGWGTAVAI